MRLSAGERLGPYEIVSPIGAGGMGEVYRARDTRLGRFVAVKLMCETFGADVQTALLREARAAAALNHPNICTIHEIGDADGHLFIVMEHVEGRSMQTLVGEGLEHAKVMRYGTQIGDALAHAHGRGIIHRDLKSANLMVTPDERVKVLDFGIAKLTGDGASLAATAMATASGMISGTPAYMAPEVLRGSAADPRSDIWAIGVVLYEMTAGRRPFSGDNTFDVSAAILRDEPPPLSTNVPPMLRSVIARCLEKDPAARFQQAGEIRAALEAEPPAPTVKVRAPRARAKPAAPRTSKGRIRSLAVLPLESFSRDPDQDYFVDGMTEELIAAVAGIEGLRVISRLSIMRFKKTAKSVPEIARELGVDAVIVGSVKQFDGRARIHVQLIDPRRDAYVWSSNFEDDLRNLPALERMIAEAVADQIAGAMSSGKRSATRRIDPEAHAEYLKGRQCWHRFTEPDVRKGLQHFQNALERDPSYAPAYAGMALCHVAYAWLGAAIPHHAFPRAKAAAARAIETDETIADAYAALGYIATFYEWDWTAAERALRKAIELQPSSADAHLFRAWFLNATGRGDDAAAEVRLALRLDPLSSPVASNVSYLAVFARRFDVAEEFARQALELNESGVMERWGLGVALAAAGRLDESIAELERAAGAWPGAPILGWLGYARARSNDPARAHALLDRLESMPPERTARSTEIARILAGLGEHDRALAALADACEGREPALGYIASDPCWDPIADDERFKAILKTIGVDDVPRPLPR